MAERQAGIGGASAAAVGGIAGAAVGAAGVANGAAGFGAACAAFKSSSCFCRPRICAWIAFGTCGSRFAAVSFDRSRPALFAPKPVLAEQCLCRRLTRLSLRDMRNIVFWSFFPSEPRPGMIRRLLRRPTKHCSPAREENKFSQSSTKTQVHLSQPNRRRGPIRGRHAVGKG